ncbi:MAG TPA: helix-turn-helix domain-containing protein [Ignavibacteriales bacterium]|nr:helix-turn-helix domain-containing protein [Ignavibacteriales bacterium]
MLSQSKVDETLRDIFSEPQIINVICSVYEKELTPSAISGFTSLDSEVINGHLEKLTDLGLVKKVKKGSEEYFSLAYPKVCDAILMLKDAVLSIK